MEVNPVFLWHLSSWNLPRLFTCLWLTVVLAGPSLSGLEWGQCREVFSSCWLIGFYTYLGHFFRSWGSVGT